MKFNYLSFASRFALLLCLMPALGYGSSGGHDSGAESAAYPGYLALDPAVTVNLASERRTKYLRVDVQLYLETAQDAALVTQHMSRIRDRLITSLGGRQADQIMSMEARDQLRAELLEQLRETMTKETGVPAVSALYFTGFIIQ